MNETLHDRIRGLAPMGTAMRQEIDLAVDRCRAVVRVQVSGRAGVGKSSVRSLLLARANLDSDDVVLEEAASIDLPGAPDPDLDGDVVVHVVAGRAQSADVAAVSSAAGIVVPVLNKVDTIDRRSDAVDGLSAKFGVDVHPLMATVALGVLQDRPTSLDALRVVAADVTAGMLLTPERFLRAPLRMSQDARAELVEQIELVGVAIAVDVLAAAPATDDAAVRALLAERSGFDGVAEAVGAAIDRVRAQRTTVLLRHLRQLAVRKAEGIEVERFLASDEAVFAGMRANLVVLGQVEDTRPSIETVRLWRRRFETAVEPDEARAAAVVGRGYLRLLNR